MADHNKKRRRALFPRNDNCVYGEGGGVVLFPSCHTLPPEKYVVLDTTEQMRKKNYIYIYARFKKGFHVERYIDRYILLFSCTCARVHLHLLLSNL